MRNSPDTAAPGNLRDTIGAGQILRKYGIWIFFLLALAGTACFTPGFLSMETLDNILVKAFPVLLVALGMTMVISSGGIDI